MEPTSPVLSLVQQALDDLDRPDVLLSTVIRKALRVARIRNHYEAVYWLQRELEPLDDKDAKLRAWREIAHHFTREELREINHRQVEHSMSIRGVERAGKEPDDDKDQVSIHSVPELEMLIAGLEAEDTRPLPTNLHPQDVFYFIEQRQRSRAEGRVYSRPLRTVLSRISHRVHTYLSEVERDVLHGRATADIFEQNRQYVDTRLREVAPEVLDQLQSAYRRVREGDTEARSQALTSCRRAMKSMADRLYPARREPVLGADGVKRTLTDDKFVSRLWQFIAESRATAASVNLLIGDLSTLGKRIDRLNELASKGVHAEVTEFEVNNCVLSTYTVIGDLLRLQSEQSAAFVSPEDVEAAP